MKPKWKLKNLGKCKTFRRPRSSHPPTSIRCRWPGFVLLLSGRSVVTSQQLFVWYCLFNLNRSDWALTGKYKKKCSLMQWVKSQPCHMPRRWVMKCGLPEFIGNRGSFVCNAHRCLDKLVPRNANLQNTSSLGEGHKLWGIPERDESSGFFVHL